MKNQKEKINSEVLWYDRQGKPLTTTRFEDNKEQWLKEMSAVDKLLGDMEYKIVKQQKLWWGGRVSTVWLGLDHNFLGDRILIFETMIFSGTRWKDMGGIDMDRYSTEEEAIEGHKKMYRKWSNPINILRYLIDQIPKSINFNEGGKHLTFAINYHSLLFYIAFVIPYPWYDREYRSATSMGIKHGWHVKHKIISFCIRK